ncbi:unnamed protein product, partial [Protopolystoma xenopodis]
MSKPCVMPSSNRRRHHLRLLLFPMLLLLSGCLQSGCLAVQITTTLGRIESLTVEVTTETGKNKVEAFLGIPYAKPPTGRRRFAPPQLVEAWGEKVMRAVKQKPSCYQPLGGQLSQKSPPLRLFLPPDEVFSEDCLYLNIWVPAGYTPGQPDLSTLVWTPCSSFIHGSTGQLLYQGAVLA